MISALNITLSHNNLNILRPEVTKNLTNLPKKFCESPPRLWNGWINFLNCSGKKFSLSCWKRRKKKKEKERRQGVQISGTEFNKKVDWITLFWVKGRLLWFVSQQNRLASCRFEIWLQRKQLKGQKEPFNILQ